MLKTSVKQTGDVYGVNSYNDTISQELQNAVLLSGQALNAGDQTQLAQACARVGATIFSYRDTGIANNYILNPSRSENMITKYIEGMTVIFQVTNTNTGTSYVNVSGLGNVEIVNINGTSLIANQLIENFFAELIYRAGKFVLIEENAVDATLRTQLADTTPNNEGSRLVGHINSSYFNFLPRSFGKIQWDGALYTALNNFNVISLTHIGVGIVDVNFIDPMSTTVYGCKCSCAGVSPNSNSITPVNRTVNTVRFNIINNAESPVDTTFHFSIYEVR